MKRLRVPCWLLVVIGLVFVSFLPIDVVKGWVPKETYEHENVREKAEDILEKSRTSDENVMYEDQSLSKRAAQKGKRSDFDDNNKKKRKKEYNAAYAKRPYGPLVKLADPVQENDVLPILKQLRETGTPFSISISISFS